MLLILFLIACAAFAAWGGQVLARRALPSYRERLIERAEEAADMKLLGLGVHPYTFEDVPTPAPRQAIDVIAPGATLLTNEPGQILLVNDHGRFIPLPAPPEADEPPYVLIEERIRASLDRPMHFGYLGDLT